MVSSKNLIEVTTPPLLCSANLSSSLRSLLKVQEEGHHVDMDEGGGSEEGRRPKGGKGGFSLDADAVRHLSGELLPPSRASGLLPAMDLELIKEVLQALHSHMEGGCGGPRVLDGDSSVGCVEGGNVWKEGYWRGVRMAT